MVKEVKSNGRLKLSSLVARLDTIEGEGCTIFTRFGRSVRGSHPADQGSTHVFATEVSETKRTADTLEVRLDARPIEKETLDLGIGVGDFVALTRVVEMNADSCARVTWMIKPVSPRWWRLSRLSRMPVSSRSGLTLPHPAI